MNDEKNSLSSLLAASSSSLGRSSSEAKVASPSGSNFIEDERALVEKDHSTSKILAIVVCCMMLMKMKNLNEMVFQNILIEPSCANSTNPECT